jgi:hypothetical protein
LTVNEETLAESPNRAVAVKAEARHAEFVKSYRDFANGGAKEQDAILNARVTMIESQEMQKRLDEEAFKDLFGDNEEDTTPNKTPVSALDSHDKGKNRAVYMGYFNKNPPLFGALMGNTQASNSLLDEIE